MKSLAELVQAYNQVPKGKKVTHWKQDVVNTLIEVYGLDERLRADSPADRFKKTYGKWLGIIKRSKKQWPEMMDILKTADQLPVKYNKLGFIINKLKPVKTQKLL